MHYVTVKLTKMSITTALKYINYRLSSYTEHDLHSPFLFDFYNELIKNKYPYNDFDELNKLRQQLLNNDLEIEIEDYGAGSKKLITNTRKIKDIVKHGIAQKKQAEFIYRLLNKFLPNVVIELGTSVGLTSLYMAKSTPKSQVYTIEGCKNLHQFAANLFNKYNTKNIHALQGTFDIELPKLLQSIDTIDFLYIDGNHTYDATMRYFEMILNKIHSKSIIMFDDINWSDGMQKAWQEVCSHEKVKLSLDFFHFGIIFFRAEQKEKEHFVLRF